MKKLFALGLLSLAAIGWTSSPAAAWWPCYPLCGKNKCSSTFVIRQYNAFTPVCSGNVCCTGCLGPCMPSCAPWGQACPPASWSCGPAVSCDPCGGSACYSGDMCNPGQLPAPGDISGSMPPAQAPASSAPSSYYSPMPRPADGIARPLGSASSTYLWPRQMPGAPIQPAAYQPMPRTVAPYYWNAR